LATAAEKLAIASASEKNKKQRQGTTTGAAFGTAGSINLLN
jgi:hypothetical protein